MYITCDSVYACIALCLLQYFTSSWYSSQCNCAHMHQLSHIVIPFCHILTSILKGHISSNITLYIYTNFWHFSSDEMVVSNIECSGYFAEDTKCRIVDNTGWIQCNTRSGTLLIISGYSSTFNKWGITGKMLRHEKYVL